MMAHMGVPSPLTSYVWVTVNGSPWGLYLAVEEPEDAFACRNYGDDHGQLYKPDYKSLEDENADVALRYVDAIRTATRISSGKPGLMCLRLKSWH